VSDTIYRSETSDLSLTKYCGPYLGGGLSRIRYQITGRGGDGYVDGLSAMELRKLAFFILSSGTVIYDGVEPSSPITREP